jgi:Fe-S-cluster containining protein
MTQNLSNLCKSCNGVCCRIFCLPASKKQILLDLISFKKDWRNLSRRLASKFDLLIILIFFRYAKFAQEHTLKNYPDRFAYRCIAISKTGRCLIYHIRPKLCRTYDCYGTEQIGHAILNLPRLNLIPENENTGEVVMKEDELCTKMSS